MTTATAMDQTTLLYEISQGLNKHTDLKKSLYSVLDLMSSNMNMVRGMITIFNPLREEISIEVAHGIPDSAIKKGIYKLGEGITGKSRTGRDGCINCENQRIRAVFKPYRRPEEKNRTRKSLFSACP
jgi:hypothetical protein